MNERIKALMEQAVTFRLDPDSNAYEAQVSPEDLEIFAELIIQECANVCHDADYQGFAFAKVICNHFGVSQ